MSALNDGLTISDVAVGLVVSPVKTTFVPVAVVGDATPKKMTTLQMGGGYRFVAEATPSADNEVVFTNLPTNISQLAIDFTLARSAHNTALELQVSTDNGSTWLITDYSVGSEAKVFGSSIVGAQNNTSQSSVEVAVFGTGAANRAMGNIQMSLGGTEVNNVLGTISTTCRRDGVTDTIWLHGGFRRFQSTRINAVRLFVSTGDFTGFVQLRGVYS